jgi:hypothetical protein
VVVVVVVVAVVFSFFFHAFDHHTCGIPVRCLHEGEEED